jgi:hypothetical protein
MVTLSATHDFIVTEIVRVYIVVCNPPVNTYSMPSDIVEESSLRGESDQENPT